jgi:succinate dehydrogenase / fumarate reductase flavoprotein subunit
LYSGNGAANYAKKLKTTPTISQEAIDLTIRELEEPFNNANGKNPYDVHKQLNQIMGTYVGIFREENDLQTGISKLQELKVEVKNVGISGSRDYNPGWHMCWDLKNMMIISEAIAKSALSRKESRGAHSRLDYPDTDPQWGKLNTSVFKDGEQMKLEHTPTLEMPDELKQLFAKKEPAHA